jgi:hypothetical protein
MLLWGLADYFVDEIVEFHRPREAADPGSLRATSARARSRPSVCLRLAVIY